MGRYRFVKPEVVRLDLSDGDWIEIKARLSYYDRQKLIGAGVRSVGATKSGTDEWGMDMERVGPERLMLWLVDWSFRDEKDKPMAVTMDNIKNLDPDTADEITAAINKHTEAIEAEKKVKSEPMSDDSP